MDREGFRNRLKQYKKAREENPGLKYYDFMERLAEFKAKQWGEDEDVTLMDLLNANDYNYRQMYEDDPNYKIDSGHFDDEYKTIWHPTFSEESRYSGKQSEYNPEGVVGGSWDTENKRFYLNDRRQSKQKAQDYLNYNDPGYQAIPKYDEGGRVIPTQEEYITQQIDAKKAAALAAFINATEPVLPIINGQPNVNSCIYTALNMYGKKYATPGNWTFYDNPGKHGFKQKELSTAQPADLIQVFDKNKPYHMMMLDGYDEQGRPLYNYSRGVKGDSSDIVKAKTNFPNTKKLAYEFVGTPADSTHWKNEYKQLYGYADGGEVVDNDFMKQFGKQVSYKPEETSWWSNVKNWWNDLTGMKNYAYGNCATTPNGKHTKECAHYSNAVLRNRGYKNIIGDAWTRAANSGMKKITSGYDGLTKPAEWDESDAHDYLQSAANNFINNVDTTALNPYDVIGLYYPDSPNMKKAFEQGRWGETQTHTGHIAVGNDGTHYVVHNVGGHLKMNKLADMLTGDYDYLPVSAYRPKK